MPKAETPISRTPLAVFLAVLRANGVIAALLFLGCFGVFVGVTLPMDNDFAEYARQHAIGTAIWANLKTVPGYLLLLLAYTTLGYPLMRRSKGLRERRRLRGFGRVLLTNVGIYVLSLGLAARQNPAFLDAQARYLSPVFPDLNLYGLYDLHVIDVLFAGLLALGAFAAYTYLRAAFRGKKTAVAALSLACAVGAIAPGPSAPSAPTTAAKRPLNVLIIGSDSLRADHLSCYGYARATSADHIDRLAREGVTLESMHVATASTLESWTSILSAQFPVTHGLRYMFPSKERVHAVARAPHLLPMILSKAGYHTTVSSNWAGNCFGLVDMGFRANHASDIQNLDVFIAEATLQAHFVFPLYFNNSLGETLYPEVRQITSYLNPGALLDRLEQEIDHAQDLEKPFFAVLFTSTTHLPYAASHPFNVKWVDRNYRGPNRYQIDFQVDSFIQEGFREKLSPDEVQHIKDLYDGTVSEFDHQVGQALAILEKRGLLDETLVIVTSDHGDDLYEPGCTLGHGTNFFGGDQSTRIPFVMRFPKGAHAGTRVRQTNRNVDIAPTILDILELPSPSDYEGVSLLPAIQDQGVDQALPAFAETCYLFFPKKAHGSDALLVENANKTLFIDPDFRNNFVLKDVFHQKVLDTKDRMMRTRRWKLVHIPGKKGPIYRFFDMLADPLQERDLSEEDLPVMRRMITHLNAYWEGRTDLRWTADDDDPSR